MAVQTIGPLVVRINGQTLDLTKKLKGAEAGLTRFANKADAVGKRVGQMGRTMTMRVTAPIAAIGGLATKGFMDFEAGMRNVNTIARQTEEQLEATSGAVIEMSTALGAQPQGMTEALYNINSASFQAAEGLVVLKQATIAARAGVTQTATAARGLTAVLNAYGKGAEDAADVSDIMFKTVEKGVLTYGELANHMGTVVATAAAAKIRFAEVSAAAATMTRGGINAAQAFTSLNRMIMRLMMGTPELNALFAKTAAGSARMMLQQKGLAETVAFLAKETKGEAGALLDLGFRLRDLKATLSLTRNEGRDFAGDIAVIANESARAGATMDAFNQQTKSLRFQWDQLRATLSAAGIELGKSLAPMVANVISKLKEWIQAWRDMDEATKQNIIRWAGIAAVVGPVLIVLGAMLRTVSLLTIALVLMSKATRLAGVSWAWASKKQIVAGLIAMTAKVKALGSATLLLTNASLIPLTATLAITAALLVKATMEFVKWRKAVDEERKSEAALQWQLKQVEKQYGSLNAVRQANQKRWLSDAAERKKGIDLLMAASREQERLTSGLNQERAGRPAYIMSEDDKKAQVSFQDALQKSAFDQLSIEGKINTLITKRQKLITDIAKLQQGSVAFFEARENQVAVETEIRGLLDERTQDVKNAAKQQATAPQFTAAVEAGSVEAYRLRIGATKKEEVAKINKRMDDKLKNMVEIGKANTTLLREAVTDLTGAPQVVTIV